MRGLERSFYLRDARAVARDLLGKYLVVNKGGIRAVVMVSETEAYLDVKDLASHASKGKTHRNKVMWEMGGHLYVYLIYGMYHCLNIVTGLEGSPSAVLVRGGVPIGGVTGSVDGPGKLCRELGISLADNGLDLLTQSRIRLEDWGIRPREVTATPRIGVGYAGDWVKKPWRYLAEFDSHPREA